MSKLPWTIRLVRSGLPLNGIRSKLNVPDTQLFEMLEIVIEPVPPMDSQECTLAMALELASRVNGTEPGMRSDESIDGNCNPRNAPAELKRAFPHDVRRRR